MTDAELPLHLQLQCIAEFIERELPLCRDDGVKRAGLSFVRDLEALAAKLDGGIVVSVEDARLNADDVARLWSYAIVEACGDSKAEPMVFARLLLERIGLRTALLRQTHSKSEYRRLTAQGVAALPPKPRCAQCSKPIEANDDAGVCIECGGRNRRKPPGPPDPPPGGPIPKVS